MDKLFTRKLWAMAAGVLWIASAASAQAVRSGKTFVLGGTPSVVAPDAAYDPVHDRYLVVHGRGFTEGLLTAADGHLIAQVSINASRNAWPGEYAQTARVAFSPDVNNGAGGYLVTWHDTITPVLTQVRARFVSADATPLGPDFIVSTEATVPGRSTNWSMGAAVAYATTSHEFLVAWMGDFSTNNVIRFTRVSVSGTILQTPVTIAAGTPEWERDPAVAYNPDTDEFFIAYAGYHGTKRYAYVRGQRVKAGTGQLLGAQLEYAQADATYMPAVTYNTATKQYFLVWYHFSRAASIYGVHLNADATPATPVRVVSANYASLLSVDVKYNPISGDYLLVTYGPAYEAAAVSIRADGTPYDNGFIVTNTADMGIDGNGHSHQRLVASTKNPTWLVVTAFAYKAVGGQFVKSLSTTATTAATPAPSGPVSAPLMNVDTPANGTTVSSAGFHVAGWAIDRGAPSGTGVDAVHVWAWPIGGGSPTFLGAATLGIARPDVAGAYGAAFSGAGFGLIATGLPAGTYDLTVYAHSTVTGNFDIRRRRITVAPPSGPVSVPLMNVDTPGNGTTVPSAGFHVAGWAIDRGAPSGTGVDAVHVWAWPIGGGSPTFLGEATLGIARPDVAGAYGTAFSRAGFGMIAKGLSPGMYDLTVYAHSAVTGNFDIRRRRITVAGPVSIPRMAIDTPRPNQSVLRTFTIAGWAVDLGAQTTTGVDTVHIYAYPAGKPTPISLGAATYGLARPDVAGAFGASRFGASGYSLTTSALLPGTYTIVVFAHSTVAGTFNNAQTVTITVR
jgi:hypothetical protein